MAETYRFDPVDRFTAGTVGPAGARTFYLQAASGAEQVTLKVEKLQVAALVRHLSEILADLPEPQEASAAGMELASPVEPAFTVGQIAVGVDHDRGRVVVHAEELVDDDDPLAAVGSGSARFVLDHGQVAAFAVHAAQLVAAGRPPCRLCGRPLDPEGHVCIKTNGHSPR